MVEISVGERDFFTLGDVPGIVRLLAYYWVSSLAADHGLSHPAVQTIINSTDLNFDLVIAEEFFMDSWLMFGHKFKAPTITISKLS